MCLYGFPSVHLGGLFGSLKCKALGKVSSRLLWCAGTEVTTALHCSSGVELDLCISMSQLLKCTRLGKLILTLEKAQRKLSSLALQEERESPPSLPVCLLALAYSSYKERKFLPVHVREARAIQCCLKGIKNVARSKPPSIRNPEKNRGGGFTLTDLIKPRNTGKE